MRNVGVRAMVISGLAGLSLWARVAIRVRVAHVLGFNVARERSGLPNRRIGRIHRDRHRTWTHIVHVRK